MRSGRGSTWWFVASTVGLLQVLHCSLSPPVAQEITKPPERSSAELEAELEERLKALFGEQVH